MLNSGYVQQSHKVMESVGRMVQPACAARCSHGCFGGAHLGVFMTVMTVWGHTQLTHPVGRWLGLRLRLQALAHLRAPHTKCVAVSCDLLLLHKPITRLPVAASSQCRLGSC